MFLIFITTILNNIFVPIRHWRKDTRRDEEKRGGKGEIEKGRRKEGRKKERKERREGGKKKLKGKLRKGSKRKGWLEVTFFPFTDYTTPCFIFLLPLPLDCFLLKSVFSPYLLTLCHPATASFYCNPSFILRAVMADITRAFLDRQEENISS